MIAKCPAGNASISCRSRSGGSALGTAALAGDFDTVSFLLDHGADPNGWCSYVREDLNHGMGRRMQSTALCGAVIGGHTRVTELLLRKGARVNVEGGDGFPLSVAATRGDIKMMTLLISAGADIDAEAPIDSTARRESPAGPAPVIAAIQYNFPDAVQLLIDRGARMTGDFHGPGGGSVEPLSLAKKIGNPRIIEMVSRALEKP